MNQAILRQFLNILFISGTIALNALANALPLNGLTTGEISDRFEVFFVPAGYVFSIWGLIYLALIGFAVYQALPSQRNNPRLERLGYGVVLSCIFNMGWLLAWHYEQFALSVVLMVGLLLTLIVCYLRLRGGKKVDSWVEKTAVWLPFSLYLGWISVATIANVSSYLNYLGWNGEPFSPVTWTVLLLFVGVLLAAFFLVRFADFVYAAVLIWAFIGIFVRFQSESYVAAGSLFAALLIGIIMLAAAWRKWRIHPNAKKNSLATNP